MVGRNVGNLDMSELDKRVSDLEYREKRNSENIQECTKAVKDMADAVNKFVVHAEVSKVKEESQIKFNHKIESKLDALDEKVDKIILDRATESQARNWLSKHWIKLALFTGTAGGAVLLTKIIESIPK